MSKYDAPQGPPPNYPQGGHYDAGPVDQRGANSDFYQGQQQYPPQQGLNYPQQAYQQYPPGQQPMQYGAPQYGGPQQGYQQQGYPPQGAYQDNRGRSGGGAGGCFAGICAGIAACCCLDMLF